MTPDTLLALGADLARAQRDATLTANAAIHYVGVAQRCEAALVEVGDDLHRLHGGKTGTWRDCPNEICEAHRARVLGAVEGELGVSA